MFLELAIAGKFPLLSDILLFTYNFGEFFLQAFKNGTWLKRRKYHPERYDYLFTRRTEVRTQSRFARTQQLRALLTVFRQYAIRKTSSPQIFIRTVAELGQTQLTEEKWVGFLIGSLLDHYNRLNDNFDQSWYDHDDDGDNDVCKNLQNRPILIWIRSSNANNL